MKLRIERVSKFTKGLAANLRSVFPGKDWNLDNGLKFVADDKNYFLLASQEEKIAGFLTAHRLLRLDRKPSKVLIYEIEVAPLFRKQGIATRMIKTILSMAKQDGAVEVWVPTNKSNQAAIALYRKTGATNQDSDDVIFKYTFN